MAGFKFTGLGAGSANGDSIRWQQSAAGVMTTLGDFLYASAANTPARLPATATVAAHATTMDPWGARNVILSGTAVTFTDLADADYVGQVVWLKMNAAHVWTNSAPFTVQGGANYTSASGDWIRLEATAVDAFDVTIFPVAGPVSVATQAQQEAGSVTNAAVTPGVQQFHQSALKAWVEFTWNTGVPTIAASYNVGSLSDTGTGTTTVNFTNAMSTAAFGVVAGWQSMDTSTQQQLSISTRLAGSFEATFINNGSAADNPNAVTLAVMGDL